MLTGTDRFTVALVGFSSFERSTLSAFFRLAARRTPAYEVASDAAQADLVILDGGQHAAAAPTDPARCIVLGGAAVPDSPWRIPRPINMMALTRLLDECAAQHAARLAFADMVAMEAAPATPSFEQAAAQPSATLPAPVIATAAAQERPATPSVPGQPYHQTMLAAPLQHGEPTTGASKLDHILVVDDSDIALRFMAGCLERFGFQVHLARSGEEALVRLSQMSFEMVFMDVNMPGLDGHQTCKAIKRKYYAGGARPPHVVMLTSRNGRVDKLRGTMAGCDAYLTKPLQRDELLKLVGDRIVTNVPDRDTMRLDAN